MFTIKYKVDGSIKRHKTRLVAKGHMKTLGIDLFFFFDRQTHRRYIRKRVLKRQPKAYREYT